MIIRLKPEALKQSGWGELAARFLLGGLATVLTGVVADMGGPMMGGLFLAFPMMFCASATLVERHERTRKEQKGLKGARRGRDAAALYASGAALAGFGMAAFGACIWFFAAVPVLAISLSIVVWGAVSSGMWSFFRR